MPPDIKLAWLHWVLLEKGPRRLTVKLMTNVNKSGHLSLVLMSARPKPGRNHSIRPAVRWPPHAAGLPDAYINAWGRMCCLVLSHSFPKRLTSQTNTHTPVVPVLLAAGGGGGAHQAPGRQAGEADG